MADIRHHGGGVSRVRRSLRKRSSAQQEPPAAVPLPAAHNAVDRARWPLVVIAVLLSVVATFFYLRVIVFMYFSEPVGDGPTVAMPSVLTVVVIAVGLGIASTLAIAAVQKTRQIGILKALGMTNPASGLVFVWQGGMLGVAGTALGVAVGWALILAFDAASSSAALFPLSVDPVFVAISACVGVGIALLSALIPYRRTSRLDPIEVIQNG